MRTKTVLRWLGISATFLLVLTAAFLPMLFLLASTALHDGDGLPGPLLLSATIAASAGLALLAAWLVHKRLRALAAENDRHVEA
jgi:hypothetical protein